MFRCCVYSVATRPDSECIFVIMQMHCVTLTFILKEESYIVDFIYQRAKSSLVLPNCFNFFIAVKLKIIEKQKSLIYHTFWRYSEFQAYDESALKLTSSAANPNIPVVIVTSLFPHILKTISDIEKGKGYTRTMAMFF